MRKLQIAVIGAYAPEGDQYRFAEEVGRLIASEGWVLINGGLSGVMEASAKGAAGAGGVVVGILPGDMAADANTYVSIPIVTNMGHARNAIIVQSADACIAVGGQEGTLAEIAIALKEERLVVGFDTWDIKGVVRVDNAEDAISIIKNHLRSGAVHKRSSFKRR